MSDESPKIIHPPVLASGGEPLRDRAERMRSQKSDENYVETDHAKRYFAAEAAQLLGCEPVDLVANIRAMQQRIEELESKLHVNEQITKRAQAGEKRWQRRGGSSWFIAELLASAESVEAMECLKKRAQEVIEEFGKEPPR